MNTFFNILIYLSSFQGLLVALALFRKSRDSKRVNILLGMFLLIISLTILGRNIFFTEGVSILGWKILYLGDQIIFLFGPLLYLVLKQTLYGRQKVKISFLHFIPAMLFLCLVIPYIFEIGFEFREIGNNFLLRSGLVEFAAIISLFFYQIKNHQLHRQIKSVSDYNEGNYPANFYLSVLILVDLCFVAWLTAFISRTFFPEFYNHYFIYHFIWLCLSISLIVLGYHSLSSDRSLNFSVSNKSEESMDLEKMNLISQKLISLMEKDKVYLNSSLDLNSLSEMSGYKKHDVSLALNKIQKMNFFDFVNSYRVNHFKSMIEKQDHIKNTILGIAFDSGFNSKTTFNTAFRKFVDMTPKEYIKISS